MTNEFTFFISLSPYKRSEIVMENIDRKDIFILNRHSNMTTQNINEALHRHVYNDKKMVGSNENRLLIELFSNNNQSIE
jgi:hypothetical protein